MADFIDVRGLIFASDIERFGRYLRHPLQQASLIAIGTEDSKDS
jgi:hypothetical protein